MIFERILVWSEVTSVWDGLIRGPTCLGRSDQRRFRARPQPGQYIMQKKWVRLFTSIRDYNFSQQACLRTSSMEGGHRHTRLESSSFQEFLVKDRKSCAMKCHGNPVCLSFDYCENGVCLLHNKSVHTVRIIRFNNKCWFFPISNLCIQIFLIISYWLFNY